jgi:hypothetical protein
MHLNGAKLASAFSASPQGAVRDGRRRKSAQSASRPQSKRHGMVGIRRDGHLGQNRRGVSEADFKFLDQHGELPGRQGLHRPH